MAGKTDSFGMGIADFLVLKLDQNGDIEDCSPPLDDPGIIDTSNVALATADITPTVVDIASVNSDFALIVTDVVPTETDICCSLTFTTFTYRPTDDSSLTSCSLFTNISGTWQIDQTDNTITNAGINSFDIADIAAGNYKWNVKCIDDATQSAFAPPDWTFSIVNTATTTSTSTTTTSTTTTTTISIDCDDLSFRGPEEFFTPCGGSITTIDVSCLTEACFDDTTPWGTSHSTCFTSTDAVVYYNCAGSPQERYTINVILDECIGDDVKFEVSRSELFGFCPFGVT